ncbi:MAG: hypothetical protein Q8S84_01880 [bacterium]|nr:hypothetical protein [bacterium]MDP3380305.1 hypothetical protein [bacterium]
MRFYFSFIFDITVLKNQDLSIFASSIISESSSISLFSINNQ